MQITAKDIREEARKKTRAVLSENQAFLSLPMQEQKDIYLNLVDENMLDLAKKYGLSKSMAEGPGAEMGFKDYNPGFQGSTEAFKDLVDSVDFPKFVADLLKAVFDANLSVMKQQTDSYIKLMKEATKGVADFVKKVKDDDTFAYLAETKGNQYNIDIEKQADGSQKLALTNPDGEKVDTEESEVKAHIMEAKIAMAKEHRAALREVILMGVTRLVVEKGEIEASVDFSVTANRQSKKDNSNTNINTFAMEGGYGGGFLGSIFGGPSGSMSETNTNINVSTSSKTATDDLSAKLHGKVNIKFKTDYFKLDNFAQMYGDGGVAALKPNTPTQAAPAPSPGK
jgi:hypothetical protein